MERQQWDSSTWTHSEHDQQCFPSCTVLRSLSLSASRIAKNLPHTKPSHLVPSAHRGLCVPYLVSMNVTLPAFTSSCNQHRLWQSQGLSVSFLSGFESLIPKASGSANPLNNCASGPAKSSNNSSLRVLIKFSFKSSWLRSLNPSKTPDCKTVSLFSPSDNFFNRWSPQNAPGSIAAIRFLCKLNCMQRVCVWNEFFGTLVMLFLDKSTYQAFRGMGGILVRLLPGLLKKTQEESGSKATVVKIRTFILKSGTHLEI